MIWRYFMSTDSASDHGSLYQLRNILGRTNVGKDPTKDFNSCDDFFLTVTSGHVIAAFYEVIPQHFDPSCDWMKTDDERKEILQKASANIVDSFVHFSFKHPDSHCSDDSVQEYAIQILTLGCFYLEFTDSIKEGDGERILRCWRYLLPMFWNSSRTNYANEVFRMLYQHDYELSPALKEQLLWGRCINVHGNQGKNIPSDLYMEHLNRVVKDCIKSLGSNQTGRTIVKVSRALGNLVTILNKFDSVNKVAEVSGIHKCKSMEKDIEIIVNELKKYQVFKQISSRRHIRFPHPHNILHGWPRKDFDDWMISKIKMKLQLSNIQ